MKKKFLLLMFALLTFGGVNINAQSVVVTKTPVILTGGKFEECFEPGTYVIQMQGWQQFIAYEDAEGVAFDENSTMVFNMAETCNNGGVRVTFTFSDNTTQECWWCLGVGTSIDDATNYWNHALDNSTYYLKKGLGGSFESKKSLKITKVVVQNFNFNDGAVCTYKINGGTLCGKPMTIKKGNASVLGAYGGVFTATAAQSNIFQMKNFEVGDYQKVVIKFGEEVPADWAYNYQSGVWPPSIPVGATQLEIPLNGTKLPELTIFNWNANPGAINIKEVYLYKEEAAETSLDFNEYGFATTNKKYLTAEGGLSYDPNTGVLTSNGTAGTLSLVFATAVNLEDLKIFDVKRSGNDNIVNRLNFYDSEDNLINTWNNAKLSNSGLDFNATNAFKTHNAVKKLVWEADENTGNAGQTLTITGIEWQLKTIGASKGTDIRTLPYKLWSADGDNDATVAGDAFCASNFGVLTNMIYGNQNIGDSKKYVDLTNYKKMIVRGYGTIRLFYNWHQSTGGGDTEIKPIDVTTFKNSGTTVKSMEMDIPEYMSKNHMSHFHLIGVKGDGNCFVESIELVDGTETYDYALFGDGGMKLGTAVEAMADEAATIYDVTGLTNDTKLKVELTPANPNAIFIAKEGALSNTKNVMVGTTIANLELTDGYPFAVPSGATATAATYTRSMSNKYGTVCLPYAVASTDAVKYYTIESLAANELTLKAEATLSAGTPAIVEMVSGSSITATGSGALAEAGAPTDNLKLIGTYEAKTILASDYAGKGIYAISNNQFVQATNSINLPAFRAFFTAASAESNIRLVFDEDATAIDALSGEGDVTIEGIYSLDGAEMPSLQKGINVVKFSNGEVKKVIVK